MNRQDESMSYDVRAEYEAHIFTLEGDNRALTNDLARLEREAARYRAALEEIVASVDTECRWCGAHSWALCQYGCPVAIADRALHPEEDA